MELLGHLNFQFLTSHSRITFFIPGGQRVRSLNLHVCPAQVQSPALHIVLSGVIPDFRAKSKP